jgi:hypothetical protein
MAPYKVFTSIKKSRIKINQWKSFLFPCTRKCSMMLRNTLKKNLCALKLIAVVCWLPCRADTTSVTSMGISPTQCHGQGLSLMWLLLSFML